MKEAEMSKMTSGSLVYLAKPCSWWPQVSIDLGAISYPLELSSAIQLSYPLVCVH